MRCIVGAALLVVLVSCELGDEPRRETTIETFTFPTSLEGWQPRAFDHVLNGTQIDWEADRSEELSIAGPASVRIRIDNETEAAKVFIQRRVTLVENADYDIRIEFFFASEDRGTNDLWRVIAGAFPAAPATVAALAPAFQDATGADSPGGSGHVWRRRTYQTAVRTDGQGDIYVVLGIWGTTVDDRSYYIDDVRIVFTRLGS